VRRRYQETSRSKPGRRSPELDSIRALADRAEADPVIAAGLTDLQRRMIAEVRRLDANRAAAAAGGDAA